MTDLTRRDFPASLARALEARAKRHGRCQEDEAREIIGDAVRQNPPANRDEALREIQACVKALVPGGDSLADELIRDRRAEAERE